jgi:AraC-like DNA-binding protein
MHNARRPLSDEDLERMYLGGQSINAIAVQYGWSTGYVFARLRKAGVVTRPRQTQLTRQLLEPLIAEGLNKTDMARRLGVSPALIAWALKHHGLAAIDGRQQPRDRAHTHRLLMAGYWLIYVPDHPHADKRGRVAEHRLVMETQLGRYLRPEEVVHHMNHDRSDNRVENLMLLPNQAAHMRQHVPKGKPLADGNAVRWRKP